MPDYQNSKIYELICSETGLKYIGSTTQKLSKRLYEHKNKDNECMSKTFINPKIYLLENIPCNSKEELHSIERKFIENTECVNKVIPTRTHKEWYLDNKEKINKNGKKYYLDNKEKIIKNCNDYYKNNKDKIVEHKKQKYIDNRDEVLKRVKEYSEKNKEKIQKYKEENREKLNEKKREKFACECGGHYCRSGKVKHLKTKKHINYINNLSL